MKKLICLLVIFVLAMSCEINRTPVGTNLSEMGEQATSTPDGVTELVFAAPNSGETEWSFTGEGAPLVKQGLLMAVKLNKAAPEGLVLYVRQSPNTDPFIVKIATGYSQCYINEKYLIAYDSEISLEYAKLPTPGFDRELVATVVYVRPGY